MRIPARNSRGGLRGPPWLRRSRTDVGVPVLVVGVLVGRAGARCAGRRGCRGRVLVAVAVVVAGAGQRARRRPAAASRSSCGSTAQATPGADAAARAAGAAVVPGRGAWVTCSIVGTAFGRAPGRPVKGTSQPICWLAYSRAGGCHCSVRAQERDLVARARRRRWPGRRRAIGYTPNSSAAQRRAPWPGRRARTSRSDPRRAGRSSSTVGFTGTPSRGSRPSSQLSTSSRVPSRPPTARIRTDTCSSAPLALVGDPAGHVHGVALLDQRGGQRGDDDAASASRRLRGQGARTGGQRGERADQAGDEPGGG